jgi:hypothetical protein
MSTTALTAPLATEIERVLIGGDLAKLSPEQRVSYYNRVCESVGLNPMTKPFDYLNLNGKTVLYANRNCSDQLRSIKGVSVFKIDEQEIDGLYIVTVYASLKDGRQDADKGAVNIANLKGEARANAILKAVTKAKRRVTLSICGLGWLDETEVESIPGAYRVVETGEGLEPVPSKEAQQAYLRSQGIDPEKPTSSPELIRELSDKLDEPPQGIKTIEMRHAKQVAEADAVLKDVKKPPARKKGTISFEALKSWGKLKDDLRELTGADTLYYQTLKAKGYEHADEISSEADAKSIFGVLGVERNRLKQNAELTQLLSISAEVIGQRAFSDLLGVHGALGIADVLAMGSDPLQALLTELKALVDARQGINI